MTSDIDAAEIRYWAESFQECGIPGVAKVLFDVAEQLEDGAHPDSLANHKNV